MKNHPVGDFIIIGLAVLFFFLTLIARTDKEY